jgi:hypothetical protein
VEIVSNRDFRAAIRIDVFPAPVEVESGHPTAALFSFL